MIFQWHMFQYVQVTMENTSVCLRASNSDSDLRQVLDSDSDPDDSDLHQVGASDPDPQIKINISHVRKVNEPVIEN